MSSSSDSESSDSEVETNEKKQIEMKTQRMDTDSDTSSDEEEEKPSPKRSKKPKKDRKDKKDKRYSEVHYPPVKKKLKKNAPVKRCVSESHYDYESSEKEVEIEVEPVPKKKKRKKAEIVTVPTSHPDVVVQMKKKKPGPKTQKVIIYEEDLPRRQLQVVHKSRKRGRPTSKAEFEVMQKDEGVKIEEDQIVIDRPEKKKELSARQLKRMELDTKFVEMEAVAGRKLRQTKSGKVDKRCVKERSPAQIAAAKRLAEYNKELRKQRCQEKNKTAVKEVISELAVAQELKKKQDKEQKSHEKRDTPDPRSHNDSSFSLFAF
tara:strand:- start:4459 stop:5415 length:957 start_codon:yes stop_codon:yes gene_type:complete